MKTGDGRATLWVTRNLMRELHMYFCAWEQFNLDSLEVFKKQASKWLGDKSELSTQTIECADWRKVYESVLWEAGIKSREGNTTT